MATKPITDKLFEELMENLAGYFCIGWSRSSSAKSADEWDSLDFVYDGSPSLGLEFNLAHPYSRLLDKIDYDSIVVRFHFKYPFAQTWEYRITNPKQLERLNNAVMTPYRQYREKPIKAAQRVQHSDGGYTNGR